MRCALLIVGLLAACSSSIQTVPLDGGRADAPTPAATDPIPIDALGAELSRALCAALFRCSLGTRELREVRLQITDEASCVRLTLPRAVDEFRDLIIATNAGLTRYDAAAARRCITGLGSRCDLEFESSVEVCPGLFSGTVPNNGSCWRTEECAGDAWCRHGGTLREPRLCPGTCLPRVAPGGMCRQREECSSVGSATRVLCSLVVAPGEEGGRCVAIASAPPGGDGDGCGLATAATNPPVDRRCATGLACAPTAGRSQCRPKLAAGAPCGGGDACADGTQCLPVGDGTTGVCSPLQRWREGEACPEGQLGRTGLCDAAARLQCQGGFCRAAPGDGGIGSGCGTIPCNAGLYCDPMQQRCVARRATGEACQQGRGEMCESGSCADDTMVCLPRACLE